MRDHIKGGALTEVTFFLLLALHQPRHGYAVMQFIQKKTNGRLTLGAGTLYGALRVLAEKGWIAPWGEQNGAKRAYLITEAGREAARQERQRLIQLAAVADEIMGGNI